VVLLVSVSIWLTLVPIWAHRYPQTSVWDAGWVSNKVRPYNAEGGDGPQLYYLTASFASIRDDTQTMRSRRYLASLSYDHTGWTLRVNGRDNTYGPFGTAEAGYEWWRDHRHNLPPGTPPPRRHTDWPPGSPWDVDE
jgi:hypothetical protein